MFVLAAALKRGYTIDRLYELTKIDRWFLEKMKNIISCYSALESQSEKELTSQLLLNAKRMGFSDKQIASCIGSTELAIRSKREEYGNFYCRLQHFKKMRCTFLIHVSLFSNYSIRQAN